MVEKREVRLVSRLDRGPNQIQPRRCGRIYLSSGLLGLSPNELPVEIPPSILTLLQVNIGCLGYMNSTWDFN